MKTTVYVVRHCESEGNACRRNQARFDGVVTRKGVEQSKVLAERFRDVPVTAIYSSDAYRCRVTAEPLAKMKGLPIRYRMLLREYTIGAWEATAIGYTACHYPERYERWLKTPYDHDIPGADPFWLAADRGCEAIRMIAEENPGGTVVAFSHSCTMTCAMTKLLGQPISAYYSVNSGDNTAVTKLEVDESGKIEVCYIGDVKHLPQELLRANYPGRSAAGNFNFERICLPKDAAQLRELCTAAEAETPAFFKAEKMYAEVEQTLSGEPAFAVFPMLLDRVCGVVALRRDPELPEDHGRMSLLWVAPDLRDRGYTEQAFGEAIDLLRRRGMRWLVTERSVEHHLKLLHGRFFFEPMPGSDKLLRMAITTPGLDEPVY